MQSTFYAAGSTSVSVYLRCTLASTNEVNSSLLYSQSGLTLWYARQRAAQTTVTPAQLATASSSWVSGGFIGIGNGVYRVDIPDAAFASGADFVLIGAYVNAAPDNVFTVTEVDLRNRGATVSGTVAANVTQWNGTNVPTPNTAGYPIVTVKSGTGTGELSITTGTVAASVAGTVAANVTQFGGTSITSVAELTAPPAVNNASLLDQIRYTYHVLRNKQEVTSTTRVIRRNDGTTAMASSSLTDNGTTLTVNAAT